MFQITTRKGFKMTFSNGWTVSVQFGHGNYCQNRFKGRLGEDVDPCPDAEIAAWDRQGKWFKFEDGDKVEGHKTPDEVAAFITLISQKRK